VIPLSPGKLRHRVTIQRPTEVRDTAYGDVDLQWVDIATVWASVEPLSGQERIDAAQVAGQVTHRVIMRAQVVPKITPRERLRFKGRTFQIEQPPLDFEERGWSWELLVREEV
jgi:SPP1 family predicted phage head-tail adaptor